MRKKIKNILWLVFIIIIPFLYFLVKYIFPHVAQIDLIISLATYLFFIITFMYRIDEKFFYKIKRIIQWFSGTFSSWSFSLRYYNVLNYDDIIKILLNEFLKINCTALKKENDFISIYWQKRNILNIRVDKSNENEYSLHFYTSTIDVPYRSIKKKINEICIIIEMVENRLSMKKREEKLYEVEITYNEKSPYYSFWVRTLPREKVVKFNCIIKDDDECTLYIDDNKIRYRTSRLQDMSNKIEKYLCLKGE